MESPYNHNVSNCRGYKEIINRKDINLFVYNSYSLILLSKSLGQLVQSNEIMHSLNVHFEFYSGFSYCQNEGRCQEGFQCDFNRQVVKLFNGVKEILGAHRKSVR